MEPLVIEAAPRPPPGRGLAEAARIMTLRELCDAGALYQRVARAGAQTVGTSSLYPRVTVRLEHLFGWQGAHPEQPGRALRASRSALLANLEVVPEWRRRGVGRLLIDDACQLARQAGRPRLVAFVARDNLGARRFYERLGFVHERSLSALTLGGPPCEEYARLLA